MGRYIKHFGGQFPHNFLEAGGWGGGSDIFFFFFFSRWFLGDMTWIRDPKHSFLAFPESVQKVVGSMLKIGQFFDHLNF